MAVQNERAYSFKRQWVEAEAFREMIRLSRLELRAYSFKKQWVEAEAFREMIRLSRLKLR